MIFALGVLVAGLLGLMFLPAFWRRAVRLSGRRFEMQLPLSMSEVVAERDLLRAEFAVGQRRLEQRVEQLDDARARDMSELGRKAALLATREHDLVQARQDALRLQTQLAQVQAEAIEIRAQLGAALKENYDLSPLRDKIRETAFQAAQVQSLAEERRLVIAGLETRLAGLDLRVGDLQGESASHESAMRAGQVLVERLELERNLARAEAAEHVTKIVMLETDIQERERQRSEIEPARTEGTEPDERAPRRGAIMTVAGGRDTTVAEVRSREPLGDLGSEVLSLAAALESGEPARRTRRSQGRSQEKPVTETA
ncbi:MAG: hypothetical protein JWL62_2660, partial [Hyphomicrobiales bacterium]|nr:hypothetical protein [Hyphomicrobiales bacterium]